MITPVAAVALLFALCVTPALAGDPAAGKAGFKKCKACHAIVAPDGTAIQKGGKTGPNLFGVIGRPPGSYPDFAYGDSIRALGAKGRVWDEASLAAYLGNPTVWLQETSGDAGAKSKMAFKLAKGGADIAAYLASLPADAAN